MKEHPSLIYQTCMSFTNYAHENRLTVLIECYGITRKHFLSKNLNQTVDNYHNATTSSSDAGSASTPLTGPQVNVLCVVGGVLHQMHHCVAVYLQSGSISVVTHSLSGRCLSSTESLTW